MLLAYIMLAFSEVMPFINSGTGGGTNSRQGLGWQTHVTGMTMLNNQENLVANVMAVVVIVGIAFANLFVLARLTYEKIKLKIKQKKAKKFLVDRFKILRLDT